MLRRSSRGPLHVALAENMEVDVTHRLSAMFTFICHDTESLLQAEFCRYLLNAVEHGSQHRTIGRSRFGQARDVLARYREDMNRCLRIEVAKHDDIGILIDDISRNPALCNPAENTIFHSRIHILLHPVPRVNKTVIPQVSAE